MEKEKKSTSLVTPKNDKTENKVESEDKGVFDNLHKLREQIQAQKTLERKLMEEEALKAKRDNQLREQINILNDEEFEVSDFEREQLQKDLEAERSKVEYYETQAKELQTELKKLEEDFSKIINLKYESFSVIDRTKLDLSAEFLNALSNDFDESFVVEFNKLQSELSEIRKGYWEKEDADRKLLKQIEEFQRHYDLKQQEVLGLKQQIDILEEAVPTMKQEEESIRAELVKELNTAKKQIEKFKKESTVQKEKIKELEMIVDKSTQETIQQLQKENQQLQKLMDKTQQQKEQFEEKLSDEKEQVAEFKKEITTLKRKATTAENQLEKQKEANELLKQDKIKPLQKELRAVEKELQESLSKVKDLEAAVRERDKAIVEIESLKEKLQSKEDSVQKLRTDLQEEKAKNKETLQEKVRIEKQLHEDTQSYKNQIAVLQEKLQSLSNQLETENSEKEVLAKNERILQSKIIEIAKELEQSNNDQSVMEAYEEKLQRLNEQLNIVQSQLVLKDETIRIHQEKLSTLQQSIVSKEEDLYDLNEAYKKLERETVKLREAKDIQLENSNAEITQLRDKLLSIEEVITSKEKEILNLQEQHELLLQKSALDSKKIEVEAFDLKEKVEQLQGQCEGLIKEKEDISIKLSTLMQEYQDYKTEQEEQFNNIKETANQQIAQLEDQIDTYKETIASLEMKDKEIQEQAKVVQLNMSQLQEEIDTKEQEITYLKRQLNQAEEDAEEQANALQKVKDEYERRQQNNDTQASEQVVFLTQQMEKLEKEIESLENVITKKNKEHEEMQESLKNYTEEQQKQEEKLQAYEHEISALNDVIVAKEDERVRLANKLEAKSEVLDSFQEELEESKKQIQTLEDQLQQSSIEMDALSSKIISQEQEIGEYNSKLKVLDEKLQETLGEVVQSNKESELVVAKLTEKEQQIEVLQKEKQDIIDERSAFMQKMKSLEVELSNTHKRHREIIESEQKLYDNMIESYVNQIMQERKIHEEASHTYEEQIQMLEQILEEEREDFDREIRELKRDLEDREYTISSLKRRHSLEGPQEKDDKYDKLEKQFNELLGMMSRNNIYGGRDSRTVGQMPAFTVYEEMNKPKPAVQPEAPKKEENLQESTPVKQTEHTKSEPDAYEKEIEALKAKIDSLFGKLEEQDKKEQKKENVVQKSETTVSQKPEETVKTEPLQSKPTTPDVFEYDSFSMDDMEEPSNQEELDELTELIKQKTTYIHQLLSDNHEEKLRAIADPNAQQRVSSVLNMRKSITEKIEEEKSKYTSELEQVSNRVNTKISDVYQVKTKLIKEEANFRAANDFSKSNMDVYDNKKRQLLNDLQLREEELRMLREEDPHRIKTRYLSFLREKEAQLHKLLDEEDSILATFKSSDSSRRSSFAMDTQPLRPQKETSKPTISREDILKFDDVVKEEVEKFEEKKIEEPKEQPHVEEAVEQDTDSTRKIQELKATHAEYFEKLTTLREELKKRKDLEAQLRSRHQTIDEYIRLDDKYQALEDQVHLHKEKLNDLTKSMQRAQTNKDRSEELRVKAAFMDQEILLQDAVSKRDYTKQHLQQLQQQDEIKTYLQINDNIKKITQISKTYIEKLTGLKSEIQQLNAS